MEVKGRFELMMDKMVRAAQYMAGLEIAHEIEKQAAVSAQNLAQAWRSAYDRTVSRIDELKAQLSESNVEALENRITGLLQSNQILGPKVERLEAEIKRLKSEPVDHAHCHEVVRQRDLAVAKEHQEVMRLEAEVDRLIDERQSLRAQNSTLHARLNDIRSITNKPR